MVGANSDASLMLKGLPWLKRLQGALDDEDSSDSSLQSKNMISKKVENKTEPVDGRVAKGRIEKSRRRRHAEGSNDDESTLSNDEARKRQNLRHKKVDEARRKRPVVEGTRYLKRAKPPVDATKANKALLRKQRSKKLHELRLNSGEHDRVLAFKIKRQKSNQVLKDKERDRTRMFRAAQNAKKASVRVRTHKEDLQEPQDRLRLRPGNGTASVDTKITDQVPAINQRKSGHKNLALSAVESNSSLLHFDPETAVGLHAVTESREKSGDGNEEVNVPALTEEATDEPVKLECNTVESIATMKASSLELETTNRIVKVESIAVDITKSERVFSMKTENTNEIMTGHERPASSEMSTALPGSKAIVEAAIESQDYAKIKAELTNYDGKEEGEVETPTLSVPFKMEDREEASNKISQLDTMPIPRKVSREGDSYSTASFMIPKRTAIKTGIPSCKSSGSMEQAGTVRTPASDAPRSSQKSLPVATMSMTTTQSSSDVSKNGLTRLQRKQTKKTVPIKKSSFSVQDQALMRLSRKRNSIVMAAAELAAQASSVKNIKAGVAPRMVGYEVYDLDGKTLSDLIPRMSCATKREMFTNNETYTASFFGVSRTAPTAESNGIDKCKSQTPNCYEELNFERLEDRNCYQRRMYGTVFIPQKVRGRITLKVQNARFERKSTGIRFNQDRDRESFAATLSQRYTMNKSVPRCEINRDNWQRLMKNGLGTVNLHYYNREDAEQASQVFTDDLGEPLQIQWNLKAGARIQACSTLLNKSRAQSTPLRSCSSERIAPAPSSHSSQIDSNTSPRRQDFEPTAGGTHRNSRFDRREHPTRHFREQSRYAPTLSKRSHVLSERKSRSRSRSKSVHMQHYDFFGPANRDEYRIKNQHDGPATDNHARIDGGSIHARNDVCDDISRRRARNMPGSYPYNGHHRGMCEDSDRSVWRGEVLSETRSRFKSEPNDAADSFDNGFSSREEQRAYFSTDLWEKKPQFAKARERRDRFTDNFRDIRPQHYSGQQQLSRNMGNTRSRSRSRSRPRTVWPARGGLSDQNMRNDRRTCGRGGYDNRCGRRSNYGS
ncbi:hypothetical protein CCR75_001969 [Bremia lactucae]|uniref:Uncharacterized protein n=1 Tax=Bremia lactucae TaxID=4779 RepID=A0A976IL57_BRELC|nr:hypothetical protein CCR75_001969 [Bremia lactucae]